MSIGIDAPVEHVVQFFVTHSVHHLPVVNGENLVGMLSSADLMKLEFLMSRGPVRGKLLDKKFPIAKLMRTPVVSVTEHESAEYAAALMAKHGIHCLPVVNVMERLIGILTTTDLIRACFQAQESKLDSAYESRLADAAAAAHEAVERGRDEQGIAAALLQLQQRVNLIDSIVHNAKRYLNSGQDEHAHADLARSIQRLDRFDQQRGAALLRVRL
jgi:CBS domain-containing protein